MTIFILSAVCVSICIAMLITAQTAAHPNKNILLGVTLPLDRLSEPEVKAIVKAYQRKYFWIIAAFFLAALPVFFLERWISLSLLYLALWILGFFLAANSAFKTSMRELHALKVKENWFVGEVHTLNIDTEVSRLKDKMPVSRWWFLPSFAIAAVPPIWTLAHRGQMDALPLAFSFLPLLFPLLCLWIYGLYMKRRTEVISENSEVNIACNFAYRRMWSISSVAQATVMSVFFTVSFLLALSSPTSPALPLGLFAGLGIASILGILLFTYFRVRGTQNRLLTAAHSPILSDDDVYWERGYYYNPNDPRAYVEKRLGIGFTVNMASKKGKGAAYAGIAFFAVFLCALISFFFVLDTASFSLTQENGNYRISAPLYGCSFAEEEVRKVSVLQALPDRSRTNGAETGLYALGDYNVNGYGKSKLYVYKESTPILAVELSDITVFLNARTPEQTERYLELLSQPLS